MMGNLKAITDTSEYDVVSNVTWENGRIYFIKSDEDEGATLSVTVTFNDKDKYSETQGVVDLELPKVNNLNGNHYYSFPSDIIELFGGEFTARTPTPTPEQETPTPFLLSCISKDTTVEIVDDGGYKYAFGPNGYQTPFKLNVGIYKLSVHPDHPLYLHGNDESQIKISGSTKVGIGYINDVEITVYSDFGTISYGCTAHGWMGGENNLVFDANCGLGYELPTPTPTPTPIPIPYFVSNDGNDDQSVNGDENNPFKTLDYAISRITNQNTIYFKEGSYEFDEKEIINTGLSLQGYSNEKIIFDGTRSIYDLKDDSTNNGNWEEYETTIVTDDNQTISNKKIYRIKLNQDVEIWQLFYRRKEVINARWPSAQWDDDSVYDFNKWGHGYYNINSNEDITDNSGSVIGNGTGSHYYYENGEIVDVAHNDISLYNFVTTQRGIDSTFDISDSLINLNVGSFKSYTKVVNSQTLDNTNQVIRLSYDNVDLWKEKHHYYYLENKLEYLNSENEWFFDNDSKYLYVWLENDEIPDLQNIRAKVQSYSLNVTADNVSIENINFFSTTIKGNNADNLKVNNCNFMYSSCYAHMLNQINYGTTINPLENEVFNSQTNIKSSSNVVISKCAFRYTDGSVLETTGGNTTIEDCYFNYIDKTVCNLSSVMTTLRLSGSNNIIKNNTIHKTAASSTLNSGNEAIIEYNDLYESGYLQSDGAMIHSMVNQQPNVKIRYNWVHDTIKYGIRFDGNGEGYHGYIHHNIGWNCEGGIMVKGGELDAGGNSVGGHFVYNNTFFNSVEKNDIMVLNTQVGININYGSVVLNNLCESLSGHRSDIEPFENRIINSNNYTPNNVEDYLIDVNNNDFRPINDSSIVNAGTTSYTNSEFSPTGVDSLTADIGAMNYNGNSWEAGITWNDSSLSDSEYATLNRFNFYTEFVPTPTPTPEEETPTPLGQPQSGQQTYDDIPWLTTTAKFVVANDSENDYSTLILENTSFDFDEYPFKDNIPSKNSYPSFYVYILKDSYDGNLMDIYSQGIGVEYSGNNSLGYFYNYVNGEKQSSSAFSSNSGPGLAYVVEELVAGRTASYPTNSDIISDDTYGYSNFEDWLGTDTQIKVGILGFDYDPSAGVDIMLAEYFIPCTIEYEPTPTPIPPLPDLNTWLSFDSQKFYTDANVSGQPPYRLVLENVTITESAIPSKIKTAISQGKLRLVSYPIRSTYTGSPFTPIGSDSAGGIYQPDIFFSYNGQSNQVGEGGVITNRSYSDTIRLSDFWNFYSDFAVGLTVGSALYSESGDDLDTWKGSDDVKLGFGIAIAHSDYDYEVLYNERFDLQILQFLDETPTPIPAPTPTPEQPTPTPIPVKDLSHQTNTPNVLMLDNDQDINLNGYKLKENQKLGYNIGGYGFISGFSEFIKFTDENKNEIPNIKITEYQGFGPLENHYGGYSSAFIIHFKENVGNVSIVNAINNEFIAQDLFEFSPSTPQGQWTYNWDPTPTPTPTQTPESLSKWFEFDEIKINFTDSTEKNLHLEFTNLKISHADVPEHILQAIADSDLLVSYKIVKESDLSNAFGSTSILGKYANEEVDSSNTLNFYQGISSFENGNYAGTISNNDQTYGDWLGSDTVKIQILMVNFSTSVSYEYNEIHDVDLVTQDFISRIGPSTIFKNFIYKYELVSGVTLNENLENGDFILAKNNTKLKVNLTNKVIGQLLSSDDPKNDPRAKIKSLEIGGEFNYTSGVQTKGELGTDFISELNLTRLSNIENLTIINQTNLFKIENLSEITSLNNLFISNSTPNEAHIEIMNSTGFNVDFSNFSLPTNLKYLGIFSTNTLNPINNLPDSLITLRTDMVEDLRLVSSTNSANSFISESCEANDQTTGISVNSFSNLSNLHLYSCEIFTDLKCKFPSLTNLKIVSTQTKILPELPQTLSELDISSTSISEITNGFPNNLDTLNARGSGLSEFKNIPDTLEVIDISNTPIATDASSFSISVNRGNVKTISLGGFNYIPDLSNLTGLQSLVMRDLSNSDSQLPSLPSSLKTLIIENANLQDISSLSSCNNLERVEMAGNEITDVSALNTSASTLSYLSLDNNNITSGNFSAFANLSHLGVEGNSLESLSIPQNLDSASIDNNPYSTSLPNFSNLVSSSFSLTMKSDTISSNQKINIIKSVPSDVSLTIDVKNATFPNESWWVDSNVTKLTLRGNVSNVIPTNCSNLTFNSTELSSINLSGQSFEYLSITNNTSLVNLNVGDNVNSFYFNNNPNVETFEGNPSIDNLMLSGSKIKTIEIPNSCKNVTLSNCKQLGSGIPDTESPIKLNSSYEYPNLKKIQIDESECKSEHIEAIFKEFSIFYDTLNTGTNETKKLQNVMFSYIGNSKRPTTADDFYLNLKTNAEWQFEPFDPELAQYVVLPDNELIDIDNLSANEKEPTFVTTEATSADLIVKNSQVGMLGVFPYPFFFGDQRWDFFEAGVTKLVSVGNLQQVNITWLGYGSTYLSMYDSTDSLNVSDLECVPKEIKLSTANVSSILREGDSDLLSLITNQTYIKIESNEIELFASQYQPMIFGGEAPIIFNVDAIESSDAMKIRLWRGEQLDTATEITNQVPWANMSFTNVNGSPYSTFYGNPNAYSPNGTSQIYINPLASLNVDFMSIEFADQRKLPQGYNDGIQFKFSSECNVDPTPSPTPFGSDILDTWFSSDQTKFQIYGEDDANSQDKAAFVKFDNLSINRQSLHDDLNSSIIQITLYVIDKNSHTDTEYGDINTQVVSDDVLCSSMILNSTLDEQSNSFFLYNTFGSQTEYGSQVTGLYWNKSDLSINEETAYFRISPSAFLKNIEDYNNIALVFQVATYSYNIFGASSYYYHKFENTLIKEEWGVQTPTPLPQPTPTPTPETVYEANATDWSVYTNDPSLETLLSQFNSNDLDNVTTSDPDSSFTGKHDSRDNNGTGWVTTYLSGALHGYSKQYQNNILTWELYYNNNSIVGVSRKWWASTGHLREVIIYSNGNMVGRVLWQEYETEPYIDDLRKPKVSINSLSYQQETFRDILFDFTIENPDLYPVNSFELSYKKGGSPFDSFQFDNYGHTITFNLSDVILNDINSSSDKTFEYSLLNVDSDIVEGDLLHYRIRGIGSVEGTYEYFSGYYISEPTPTPTQTTTPTPRETPTPIPQDQPTPTPVESRIVVRFNAQQASNIGIFSIIIRSLDGGTSTVKVYNSVYTYNADDAMATVVYDDSHAGGWQPFSSALVYEKYGYHDNNISGWILEVTGDIKSLKIHDSEFGNSYHNGVSSIELYGCDGIQEIPDFDSEHYKNLNYVHFKNFDAGSLAKTNPFQGMFKNQTNLYTVYGLDTIRNLENIISTAEMFNGCTSLNVDQYANSQTGASMKFGSNWSSAPITNVNHMFSNCTSLNYNNGPDFSEWCVSEIQTEPPSFASGATFTNRPRFGNDCGNVNLGGSVIDGYVKNAPGQLIDLSNGNIIKEFTSDDYGRWSIDIEQSELPDLYKVKFLPGGTDILTNKQVNTTFSNIAKKEDALTSSSTLNITPVTTLKSTIVETKIQQKKDSGESYDVDSIITTTKQFVASKFDISETDLESDYIKEQKADVLKANTKLSIITETLKSTVSQVDDSVTEDIIFASIATQFKSTMETEETSNEDISVTDLLNNNIETIVKNSVDDSFQTQITSDSSIVQNIEFLSEVVLEVIDTPSDTENSDTFEDSLQNVRKEILTTIEFVEDVVSTSDIGNEEVVMNKESALESIDNSIDLVEDIVIDDMIQPELGAEEQTPTPTFASYYFAEENQSNSHTFQKYHQDEQMIAYDNFINGVLFDVLVMKNEGFVEVYIGSGGTTSVRLGTLSSEYQSNHASGLNWVNYFESTYEGLSISTTSIQSQINMIIPNSLLEMA